MDKVGPYAPRISNLKFFLHSRIVQLMTLALDHHSGGGVERRKIRALRPSGETGNEEMNHKNQGQYRESRLHPSLGKRLFLAVKHSFGMSVQPGDVARNWLAEHMAKHSATMPRCSRQQGDRDDRKHGHQSDTKTCAAFPGRHAGHPCRGVVECPETVASRIPGLHDLLCCGQNSLLGR